MGRCVLGVRVETTRDELDVSVVVCGWVSAGGWCTIDSKER
jgi:hypothetical protein